MSKLILALADRWYGFAPNPVLKALEESQFWPQERLERLQIDSLRKLLIHAGIHVPFYRSLFKTLGFDPSGITSVRDIAELPALGKPEIMAECQKFASEVAQKPVVWLQTTGTTGQPFSFVRTRLAQSYKIASRVRFRRWYGIERNSRLLNVGGISSYASSLKEKLHHKIHFYATNRFDVFSSDLEGNGSEHAARLIERHRIKAVMGYPTGIAALARYLSAGRRLTHYPQAIFTNSETLTDLMRRQILNGFGVMPRSDYGSTEGAVAHECPEGGLHVDMEEMLVEILPTTNPDGLGEVVITALHTFDFPLIRYRLGDLAKWSQTPCSCGRGLVTLDGLLGRASDGILMPDGRVFTAANINMRIAHLPFVDRIQQYQLVQQNETALEVRILNGPETNGDTIEEFRKALLQIFPDMEIEVRRLDTLPREKTGKFRPVIGLKRDRGEKG